MINIKCKCGEIYHTDENFVGKKIICLKCKEILTIKIPELKTSKSSDYIITNPLADKSHKRTKTTHKRGNVIENIKGVLSSIIILAVVIIAIIGFFTSGSNETDKLKDRPKSGNIFTEDANNRTIDLDSLQRVHPLHKVKQSIDPYEDWDKIDLLTGTTPSCYNYKPTYEYKLDNYLQINVSSKTDVVIKLCSCSTGKCIRYVYIRHGTSFKIKNIPEDIYFTKIAYGVDWREKIETGKCIGKFVKNAFYKKGEETLDYHKKYIGKTKDGEYEYTNYKIPSFSLKLDVIETDLDENVYQTNSINEEEFNI